MTNKTPQQNSKPMSAKQRKYSKVAARKVQANQVIVDPRQEQFLTAYLDPNSETYSNAYKSALRVGYAEEYARGILSKGTEWIAEANERRKNMLKSAERRLAEFIHHEDPKIAQDTSKFVAKTLGKEFYSERTEHTGKDGKSITVSVIAFDEYNNTPQLKDPERA